MPTGRVYNVSQSDYANVYYTDAFEKSHILEWKKSICISMSAAQEREKTRVESDVYYSRSFP